MPKRTDANHKSIMQAYRALGCSVEDTSQLGKGFPDLAVGCMGITDLVEVKDGLKYPSKRKLTPDEVKWHDEWRGSAVIVESDSDVIGHVREMRQRASVLPETYRASNADLFK